jgi:multidrug transporter EmrE-like cation transporter
VTTLKLTTVPVSITDSLFSGSGSVMITAADVLARLLPR